jgi:hypothetical protein
VNYCGECCIACVLHWSTSCYVLSRGPWVVAWVAALVGRCMGGSSCGGAACGCGRC